MKDLRILRLENKRGTLVLEIDLGLPTSWYFPGPASILHI